jgi:beta-lactamase class A
VTQLANPRSGEAVFGDVVAPAPRGTIAAELQVDGAAGERTPVLEQNVVLTSQVEFGRHDLTAVFFGNQPEPLGTATSEGVWGLPASALAATDGAARDGALSRRLERVARGFPGYSAVWVQDLATGQTAGYNADARFPAASTVKLALLIGALGRQGSSPEDSRDTYDLRAMAGWSSNLATNRILATMGGSALAQRVMTGVGATRSTFTGGYIVGTEIQPALPSGGVTGEPPATSFRVTTARDLGRLLFALHASATGRADALAATGLTRHQARVGVAMLLDSEQRGDNLSLVAGGVPKGTPIAQKNGWLRRARHGAAIIYGPGGPRIVVVLTYADRGISREQAAKVGAAAARASP